MQHKAPALTIIGHIGSQKTPRDTHALFSGQTRAWKDQEGLMTHHATISCGVLARRWRALALIVTLALAAMLAVPLATAAPKTQTAVTLRIAYLGTAESPTAQGAQLAIGQINEIGGFRAADGNTYRFKLLTLDRAPTVQTLPAQLQDMLDKGIVAFLGPDDNALITQETILALSGAGVPVLTPATADALTDTDQTDHIFRVRAPEHMYSYALATYLYEDRQVMTAAVLQTDVQYTEALLAFEATLTAQGADVVDKIQLPNGERLLAEAERLLPENPDAVVMWGAPEDAAALLTMLREGGWGGVFAYRQAAEAARMRILPAQYVNGVLGMDAWSFAAPDRPSRVFLRDYVVAFGQVPNSLAVAGYDAAWFLRGAILNAGSPAADVLFDALLQSPPQSLVQGVLHPREFGNGDLSRLAVVYQLGPHGGPTLVARFDDARRLAVEERGGPPPTPTLTPTPVTPTDTPYPTPTLEGTWVEVAVNTLNVRTGPGFEYDKIGQVKLGEKYRVLGAIADYTWVVIDYQGGIGWVKSEYVTVLGEITDVSIVQPPPTPTPAATPTPTLPPNPDIVIDTVILNPAQPIPGKPFTATVTVRNGGGGAAGQFAVAATWDPGAVFTAAHINGLAGGQTTQVQLSGTMGTATGIYQIAVVADLNNEVAEANEQNNLYNITYRVDYPLYANQSGIQLNATTQWDLYGGTQDLQWDGSTLSMLNGALIGLLPGATYDAVHYDMLTPAVVSNASYGSSQVTTGAVFGVYTAEGERGVLRIDNRQGGTIWISYRVYNDTP